MPLKGPIKTAAKGAAHMGFHVCLGEGSPHDCGQAPKIHIPPPDCRVVLRTLQFWDLGVQKFKPKLSVI